jgi:hypothetical protein
MKATPENARAALADMERIVTATRQAVLALHVADHLILWGLIWMAGFGLSQFTSWHPGWIWLPLSLGGMLMSVWIGWRKAQAVSSPVLGRIFWSFVALLLFAIIWAVLLHPFNHRNFAVYLATVFMLGYVTGGLWFGRFFVFLGMFVTGAALAGVFVAPQWIDALMAVLGGGALLGSGIYIRYSWKPCG